MVSSGVRHTHLLRGDGDVITKTYRGWGRDQHLREWSALNRLAVDAPGPAPAPVGALLDARPPSITMTMIPGQPIAGRWTDHQISLLADVLRRLWQVSSDGLPPIDMHQPDYWRQLAAGATPPVSGIVRDAYELVVDWLGGAELDAVLAGAHRQILGQGDPQPGNLLWDGEAIRLVDFEDSGASDVCFDLANFAEHIGTRGTGLHHVAELIQHDSWRYRRCRRLLASFWFFRMLPDLTGARRSRTVTLHDQAVRLVGLFD